MPVERLLATTEANDLIALTREIARNELAPAAAAAEEDEQFPREKFKLLGDAGLLGLPYPEEFGGANQPYETYLQVLEELSSAWMTVGVGLSVHTMSCYPLAESGTDEQRRRWLGEMLGGQTLGGYALSEPQAGSDASALRTTAEPRGSEYSITGTKCWITHGGVADFYTLMARTADDEISCLLVDGNTRGVAAGTPERKMGLNGSPTTELVFDGAPVEGDRLIGERGQGMRIALRALDSGRLGIAACAVGLAQAALELAVEYAKQRSQFGQPVIRFQGVEFMLADMEAAVQSARATYLDAARRRDAGRAFGRQAAVAKLIATDAAMKVTTDAVQVLGGAGYTRDFPAERYMREAKVLQIFEGTNQIQRTVIGRELAK
ncbi:acyl-CoA dehydrogenase family protein [Actinopolyspora halophila]|uniref:acyl-CoA dehydrogenase family protein n=1 Tax=Actinopolyspora halophila TaxID=1850 RepID=UPI0003827CCB|nr:acyl-CoA dehydrogenase family protein [Actinopolyspora halophila]